MCFITENLTSSGSACYLALFLILLSTFYYFIRSRGLPPGPTGFPYIGYWPFFDASTIHFQLEELRKKYGDVFSFTVTGRLYISLCSYNAIREVEFKKPQDFETRASGYNLLNYYFQDGIAFSNGEEWKVQRKYYIQQLKELGMTTFREERKGPIYDAVNHCVKDLEKIGGKPVDLTEIIVKGSSEILRTTLFAGEEDFTCEDIKDVCHSYEFTLQNMTGPNLLLIGDFAKYFIHPFTKGHHLAMEHFNILIKKIFKMLNKHKSSFNENNVRNDIFDRYFKERSDRLARNDPTAQYFTDKALVNSMFVFIGDGVMTVGVFVCTFFKALLDHPEEQEKIYNELVDVVGVDRDPGIEDKSRLPYTNAFILEVTRTSEVLPFIPELECTRETIIQGHRIPKGSVMMINVWAAHHDPNEYEEPHKFNPSRYIPEKGKKKPEAPILFGTGRRACIGEGYVMAQTFLFLTTIVKHFRLTKATDEDKNALFLVGKMEVCAHPRNPT
ncbi:cytochrome P450 2F3 [Parasteatoda tepidariorum]|uniref:cytochrome P450 2F3 n=1 Tax=Parasteatoda tepidariorum TaxID=114398 RepID=UPI00077F984A|nr:cytochrome P450 2F3 [Parasteatoda tepidariorum]XP_015921090.1 cytochrome P450 2F3 [Parasteatoda tepidariorum]